jgi:hypothetical protein
MFPWSDIRHVLCQKGFNQEYEETCTGALPYLHSTSPCSCLWCCWDFFQMDGKNAFINGDISKEFYTLASSWVQSSSTQSLSASTCVVQVETGSTLLVCQIQISYSTRCLSLDHIILQFFFEDLMLVLFLFYYMLMIGLLLVMILPELVSLNAF